MLSEREQTKTQMLLRPLTEKFDFAIGTVKIKWIRKDVQNFQPDRVGRFYVIIDVVNEELIPLDRFRFEKLRARVDLIAPEEVPLNAYFTIEFVFTSQCPEVMDLRTIIDSTDNFMVCGESECRVKLNPEERASVKLSVMSLKVGFFQVPGIRFTDLKTKHREEIIKSEHNKFVRVIQENPCA